MTACAAYRCDIQKTMKDLRNIKGRNLGNPVVRVVKILLI